MCTDEWDDPAGPSEVGRDPLAKMGLGKEDVTTMTAAYWKAMRGMQEGIVAKGKRSPWRPCHC